MNSFRRASTATILALAPFAGAEELPSSPIQKRLTYTIAEGFSSVCDELLLVPAHHRLVIEYASASVRLPSTEQVGAVTGQLRTTVGNDVVFHHLAFQATSGLRAVAGQSVRIYADPGTQVSFCADRYSGDGEADVIANFSGRLQRLR